MADKKTPIKKAELDLPDRFKKIDRELLKVSNTAEGTKADLQKTTDQLRTDFQTTTRAVATLNGSFKTIKWIFGILAPIVIGWLGAGTYFLYTQGGDIRAMKQKFSDSGIGPIVSKATGSGLQKNLTIVAAQVQVARSAGKKAVSINSKRDATSLSNSVADIAAEDPDTPQVWDAAAQLISYRSELQNGFQQNSEANCFLTPGPLTATPFTVAVSTENGYLLETMTLEHCALLLDDVDAYERSQIAYGNQHAIKLNNTVPRLKLILNHVHVIYRGGPIIPVFQIVFNQCNFTFQFPPGIQTIPPAPAREIMENLLKADLSTTVQIATG